ncbi:MAG: class I SAM-dependent methyltransferase [Thermoleophilaceae bacterium]
MAPFGVPEIIAAVAGCDSVLDAGCGSARLTLALAAAGATDVVGADTSIDRLEQGRARISTDPVGDRVTLIEADFDRAVAFPDGRFSAVVSRLALMIATDPAATVGELRRVTAAGGPIVTALWAPVEANPWFALPRSAAAAVVGPARADYARAFGRLGSPDAATEVHRAAGLSDVRAEVLEQSLAFQDVADLWTWIAGENGHVRRLDAALEDAERTAVLEELARLLGDHRAPDGSLTLPRRMTLVTATA